MSASPLEEAWRFRESKGWLSEPQGALRVFHGPIEAPGTRFESYAIDRFDRWYWITEWEGRAGSRPGADADSGKAADARLKELEGFLRSKGAEGAAFLPRPERGVAPESARLFGELPDAEFEVREGSLRFGIRLLGVRHPGLFLDHQPLRHWLAGGPARAEPVLNCFAYTGSLSVAAGVGGARPVTTLDLSKVAMRWAEANWKRNGLAASDGRFIAGDVFDRLPGFGRRKERFACVILDPPSFARGNKGGSFSTARDLPRLHRLALECVADGGWLVTSINSANVSWAKYEADVREAARDLGAKLEATAAIGLPERFCGPRGFSGSGAIAPQGRPAEEFYLKGWIFHVSRPARSQPG